MHNKIEENLVIRKQPLFNIQFIYSAQVVARRWFSHLRHI